MSEVSVSGEEINIAVDDPVSESVAIESGIPGEKGENGPAYVPNTLASNFTVPTGYTSIRGRTALNSGVKLVVESGAVLKLI